MKQSNVFIVFGLGILVLLLVMPQDVTAASALILDDGTSFDISSLPYSADKIARLARLYLAMQGRGLSRLQVQLMLSQALFETGLFTDSPNYNNMDALNNYAGIMGSSRYPARPGSPYAYYPALTDFVGDWLTVLSFNNEPINATGPNDFVARLKENGYFTASSTTYGNGVNTYFDMLNSISNQA